MGDQFTDLLSDYIDDEDVPALERVRVERHLEGCPECRATLTELRRVAAQGRALMDATPQRDLWPGVAERIGAPGMAAFPSAWAAQALRRRISFTVPQLAAAALALMVLSGGTVWLARVGSPGTDFEPLSAQVEPAAQPTGSAPARIVEPDLDSAIAELERALGPGRARLDPDTISVLQANLTIANRAVDDCRRALAADPSSPDLNALLDDAQRMKLMLLQRAGAHAASRP